MKSTVSQKLKIAKLFLNRFQNIAQLFGTKPYLATFEGRSLCVVNWDRARNLECNYTFPIDLTPNGIPFHAEFCNSFLSKDGSISSEILYLLYILVLLFRCWSSKILLSGCLIFNIITILFTSNEDIIKCNYNKLFYRYFLLFLFGLFWTKKVQKVQKINFPKKICPKWCAMLWNL